MDNFNEEEWELIAQVKEKEREHQIKTIERLNHLNSMPLHKRLQEKGEEEKLQEFKETSEHVFKKKGKGEFKDYWDKFLETGLSINKWNE